MGPWHPWLKAPRIGDAIREPTKTMSFSSHLPPKARGIAILVPGARFSAAHKIHVHVAAAEAKGMERVYLVGLYGLVSVTLDGFNVPVPEKA